MKAGRFHLPYAIFAQNLAFNLSREHRMRARAFLVHQSRPNVAVSRSARNQLDHVLDRTDGLLLQTLDVHAFLDVLADMQVDRLGVEQVHDLLVVYLEIAGLHQILDFTTLLLLLGFFPLNCLEDVLKGPLHNASHFELLAGAVLAGHDCVVCTDLDRRALDREGLS